MMTPSLGSMIPISMPALSPPSIEMATPLIDELSPLANELKERHHLMGSDARPDP